jgi:hypothetical protein
VGEIHGGKMFTTRSFGNIVQISFICILIGLSFIFLPGCEKDSPTAVNQNSNEREMTLNSLKRINDYPFYTMTYYGDYGFKKYLQTGNWNDLSAHASITGKDEFYCTCFAAMGSDSCRLFGRNFDWNEHVALLLYTDPPDGYASVSMVHLNPLGYSGDDPVDSPGNRRAFLMSPTTPLDGMNECGVAIGMMLVDYADPPYDPEKVTLHAGLATRLVLDYAKNAEEAVELLGNYNIDFGDYPAMHFLISDATGRSAIIEFLDNEIKVIDNTEKWQVCTNFLITGSQAPEHVDCWRYNRAYSKLKACQGNISSGEAMDILSKVAQSPPYNTEWSMVYNAKTLEVVTLINRNYSQQYLFKIGEKAYSTREVNTGDVTVQT